MIIVHRSERADRLVDALGDLLLDPLDDPMASEVVAVPTRGVERWLTQRLSHRLGAVSGADGICANVQFPFPGSVVGRATSLATGDDPDTDPWPPERSVWPLMELVDEHLEDDWLGPLVAHLRAGSPDAAGDGEAPALRRFATVRHLADLYDRYAVHRPEMVQAWAGIDGADDGDGTGSHWQAELWRRLRRRIGVPGPAERLVSAAATLMADPQRLDLPPRLSLFGLTRLPASHLRILEAIAHQRDVHLFLLHPSAALWQAVDAVGVPAGRTPRRAADPTVEAAGHPLLRSWGRDSREMQLVLASRGIDGGTHLPVVEPAGRPLTLLERLQADVRGDRPPPGPPAGGEADGRAALDRGDDSLRIHSCHGKLRQVEVVRDAVLHLLAEDPTLEPRDVVVMCPDIESFAPLVHAVFGADGRPDDPAEAAPGPPRLRVRLADRSIRQTNPVLAVAAQLLELAAGRVAASEVLDLAGREPVARRFRFDEDELGQLERWVVAAGVRWGLDPGHRSPWRLDRVGANTWEAGLDRALLGVAMAEEHQRLFADVLPLDDVSSGSVDLAGRFAEFIERLHAAVDRLGGRQPVAGWATSIAEVTESLTEAPAFEPWQGEQLRRLLGDVLDAAGGRSGGPLLDLAEVRSLLDDRLRGRPTRANFRTGDLTVCTLVPMRSVPHRVVGLLGLDDGAFPRHAGSDGDDLLAADPHVGDRDAGSEDRQLLLDALLAATGHLIVTYEGRDPRTNEERSPSVPVSELLDVVDRTVHLPDAPHLAARSAIIVEHPLQSFDQRNFRPGQLAGEGPWSFDPVDLDGARARTRPPVSAGPFLSRPLEPLDREVVALESLVRFLEHPVRAFLRDRLGWYGNGGSDQVKDALPVELDPLERWAVGDRMLDALLGGATLERARQAEHGRGLLPPGALAGAQLADIERAVESLAEVARRESAHTDRGPGSIEVNVRLPDGRLLVGTVADVYRTDPVDDVTEPGLQIVRCLYSQLGPKHRLAAWARFLALCAGHPGRQVGAVTIGQSSGASRQGPKVALARLGPLPGDAHERREAALGRLGVLVDLYDRGMCEPLPLYTKTSERYVDALRNDRDVRVDCKSAWDAGPFRFGEAGDAEHRLVLGPLVGVADLLAELPRSDEDGDGWTADRSRVGRLARRLWEPLLEVERVEYP